MSGRADAPKRGRPWRLLQAIIGTILFCALPLLSFYPWAYWGQGLDTSTVSRRLETVSKVSVPRTETERAGTLRDGAPPETAEPADGTLIGWMRIPRLGRDYRLPIQQGTGKAILDNMGAGHYKGTSMPGGPGNSAYAGHATYSDFADIRLLEPGDQIIVETAGEWIVYRATSSRVVGETDVSVLDATPGTRTITLTTCWPVLTVTHATHRLAVSGEYVGWIPKTDGVPASLAGTERTVTESLRRGVETVSERTGAPVTGVLAACCALVFLIVDGFNWLVSHGRMRELWRESPPSDPLSLSWALCAGWFPSHRAVFAVSRAVPLLLLYGALLFASWRWACPWMADHLQWLLGSYPHPSL